MESKSRSEVGSCRRWYVVHTLQLCEARAQIQLERQGFCTFLPRYVKTVRHARKCTTVSAPLFPRYLFIELDVLHDRWRSVNGTFGVANLLTANDRPVPLPIGVVEALIEQIGENYGVSEPVAIEVGEPVQISRGPFADLIGRLARIDGRGRVQVLLQLLGGEVQVSIERQALVPLSLRRTAV
jgi:transcriptional antiterminator RfaH